MIIARSAGQMGNQLFQLAFLLSSRRDAEALWCYGFNEVSELLDLSDLDWCRLPRQGRVLNVPFNRGLFPLCDLACRLGLFSSIHQLGREFGGEPFREQIVERLGLLPIRRIQKDYYQSEALMDPQYVQSFAIQERHRGAARALLDSVVPEGATPVAIHVRRGDYTSPAFCAAHPHAVLPDDYYDRALEQVKLQVQQPYFVVCSNAPAELPDCIQTIESKYISRENAYTDFALIAACQGAIIANSTFSWWAASYQQSAQVVIGPRGWLNYGGEKSWPEGICTSRFDWI